MTFMPHPYNGIQAVIATKHNKGQLVSPIFQKLSIAISSVDVDTDQLGTFSGEIPRVGTPKEVVLKKARLGLKSDSNLFATASEGSIGPDPTIPFVQSDIELMAWIDDKNGFELVESYRSFEITAERIELESGDPIDKFLVSADFPNHSLIVKSKDSGGEVFKGINQLNDLELAMQSLFKNHKKIIIENDLRANHSPSRQKNIAAAAEKLVARLANLCRKCQLPGWGSVAGLYGLNCESCGQMEDKAVKGVVNGCVSCDYKEGSLNDKKFITAAECSFCNP